MLHLQPQQQLPLPLPACVDTAAHMHVKAAQCCSVCWYQQQQRNQQQHGATASSFHCPAPHNCKVFPKQWLCQHEQGFAPQRIAVTLRATDGRTHTATDPPLCDQRQLVMLCCQASRSAAAPHRAAHSQVAQCRTCKKITLTFAAVSCMQLI